VPEGEPPDTGGASGSGGHAAAAEQWLASFDALAASLSVAGDGPGALGEGEHAAVMMPRALQAEIKHRPKREPSWLPYPAMVARLVSRAELRTNPKAQEALKKEFAGLAS
jgi:hypothetical protein